MPPLFSFLGEFPCEIGGESSGSSAQFPIGLKLSIFGPLALRLCFVVLNLLLLSTVRSA